MSRRALLLFAVMCVIWGVPYLFIRIAVAGVTPATLVFGRTAIAAAVLLPLALLRVDLRPVLARWRWVVAFAIVEVGIPWVLLGSAEQTLASSLAGLLVAGVPLVGMVIAVMTGGRDRLGPLGVGGLLLGLVGVALIVGVDFQSSTVPALLEMAVVVVGYALGPAILARRLAGQSSIGVMAVALSLAALAYLPVAVVQRPTQLPGADVLVSILVLGLFCTATAFVLFSELIDEIGPVRSTVITYINPAVAAVLGVTVLGETFSPGMGLGFGLVLAGSVLATRPRLAGATGARRQGPTPVPEAGSLPESGSLPEPGPLPQPGSLPEA